jgi:osmotically-inducible protein OsmY
MDRLAHVGLTCVVVLSQSSFLKVNAEDQGDVRSQPQVSSQQGFVDRPDFIVGSVLRANPLTAPYPIRVDWRDGSVILSGVVGTSQVHNIAVRTVIDLGYPVKDNLVIDTAAAHQVALVQAAAIPGSSGSWGMLAGSAPYFVYPPPLFGRVDDPFFGFEPPLVSFPPWTRSPNLDQASRGPANAAVGGLAAPSSDPRASTMGRGQASPVNGPPPVKGRLQLSVDMSGQVFLSGVVATEADKRMIEEEARNTAGVSQVHSDIRVQQGGSDTPPPPPQPVLRVEPDTRPSAPAPALRPVPPAPEVQPVPAPQPPATKPRGPAANNGFALARDTQTLSRRVTDALGKRPGLAGLPIGVQSRAGVVTVSGKVPSAYEAMIVYRTIEQTPGVRDVLDRLEFQLPDENHPNPLRSKGRPEDVEPYLTSQIRRHLGDLAHVDRVRMRGDNIEIRGSLLHAEDQNRAQAILRSIPLLRDFRLEPVFNVD